MAVSKSRKTTTTRKPVTGSTTAKKASVAKSTPNAGPNSGVSIDQKVVPTTATAASAGATKIPEPVVVEKVEAVVNGPALAKKELIEQVVEKTGVKKRDAKPVAEAVLALLGEAIADGRELNLKPFGKLRVNRQQKKSNGTVFVCKLRQPQEREKNVVPGEETEA